jgi:hypothetical protein
MLHSADSSHVGGPLPNIRADSSHSQQRGKLGRVKSEVSIGLVEVTSHQPITKTR